MNLRWLARVAASAALRRVVYLVIAALIGLAATCGKAQAQSYQCLEKTTTCTRQQAWAECTARSVEARDQHIAVYGSANHGETRCVKSGTEYNASFKYYSDWVSAGQPQGFNWNSLQECPAGNVWDEGLKECAPTECQEALAYGPAMVSALYMCNNGCRFEQDVVGLSVCTGGQGDPVKCFGSWKPTGGACKSSDKPPQVFDPDRETCRSLDGGAGSYSECVKPNGDHCVTSSRGSVLCWKPSEVGKRMTSDGKDGGDREVDPATPTPPDNMQDPTQVSTTTTTIGGTTYNTSVYSGTGNNGGQGDVGEGGKNTGGTGDPKGEGEGGEGEGDDKGTSSGGQGCGSPPVSSGDPLLVAVIHQQWLTRCAGDADDNGQPDWTQVEGDGTEGAGEDPDSPHRNVSLGIGMLDQNGFGLSRSCPVLGTLDLGMFGAVNLDEVSWLCDFCNAVKVILSMVGAFVAFRILAGR